MKTGGRALLRALVAWMLLTASAASEDDLRLPSLGASGSSLFSSEHEYQLGRAWLRLFRSQVPTVNDPLLQDYLEDLVYKLLIHSGLQDRRVEVVVVDNPVLNAFAVPGGVVGLHTGLLLYAQSEDELATVLAHELAHLSQRHFSRGIEQQKKQQPLTLAGLLAGAVLIATAGASAGIAALTATQAAALESQLRFSRSNEQEADRIGMQTMVDAGMDPHAAPTMFERMLQNSRYAQGKHVPEFLRTHPLSESRVSDTRNRARQYPVVKREPSLSFHLMRARMRVHHSQTPQRAVAVFKDSLKGRHLLKEAEEYGLALALTEASRPQAARKQLKPLLDRRPQRIEYIIAQAELDISTGNTKPAVDLLEDKLGLYPDNHALTMAYARALVRHDQAHIAEEVLMAQTRMRPGDPGLWYLLAEVQGLSGNIPGLHQSRAEFFILNGALDEAASQLGYAAKLLKEDYPAVTRIEQRLVDIIRLQQTKL